MILLIKDTKAGNIFQGFSDRFLPRGFAPSPVLPVDAFHMEINRILVLESKQLQNTINLNTRTVSLLLKETKGAFLNFQT